ncbi:TIM barrel protein [Phenylobacterium sp.]|uniref:hydroxypyruvate isomerase family protein n=1 Tax=Phenylobacterium sp. TaxID=1871053 RepID=UPI0028127DD1|nr:TIM barrel protein [Phenylobacterium sp.]
MTILQQRLSANLSFLFQEWSFLDRFAAAADAGFTCVEFLFPYEFAADEVARRLADNQLSVSVFNAPPGDWAGGERGLAALPERTAEFRAGIQAALDYAAVMPARRLHVMAGIAEPHDPQAMAAYWNNIDWAADMACDHGVEVLVEPINTQDMPGYFLRDFGQALELIEALPENRLGLQYDIYHACKMGYPVLGHLETLLPITTHVQIAGVPDRHEPSSESLPLREIFALFDRARYPGRVGCEYRPAAGAVEGLIWVREAEGVAE